MLPQNYRYQFNYFKELLSSSVEGPSIIPVWVQENLLNESTKVDLPTTQAFFDAEKELIRDYLTKGDSKPLLRLINEFTIINDPEINKIELGILRKILNEESALLKSDPSKQESLIKAFATLRRSVIEAKDPQMQEAWEQAKKFLGNCIETSDYTVDETITPSMSFGESLKTLPPKNYSLRYKCLWEMTNSTITKVYDTPYSDLINKIILPEPDNLDKVDIYTAYDKLYNFYQNLHKLKENLDTVAKKIPKDKKLSPEESEILTLNDSIDRFEFSFKLFLEDLRQIDESLKYSDNYSTLTTEHDLTEPTPAVTGEVDIPNSKCSSVES